jgi:hypothetical protein
MFLEEPGETPISPRKACRHHNSLPCRSKALSPFFQETRAAQWDVFRLNEMVVGKLAGEQELYTYHGYKPSQRGEKAHCHTLSTGHAVTKDVQEICGFQASGQTGLSIQDY